MFDYTDPKERAELDEVLEKAQNNKKRATFNQDMAGACRPLYCADTLKELAVLMFETTEEREAFLGEVDRYNELCRSGRDTDFGKEPHLLHPIEKAPFYACGRSRTATNRAVSRLSCW